MTIEENKTCGMISKHFGNAAKVGVSLGAESKTSDKPGLVELALDPYMFRFGSTKATCKLGDMIYWHKLEKTQLYADYLDLTVNYAVDFVTFMSGSVLVAMYEASQYDGYGGLFVKPRGERMGIAITPLKHYLDIYHPQEDSGL